MEDEEGLKTRKKANLKIFSRVLFLMGVVLACGEDSVGPVLQQYRLVMYGDSPIPVRLTHPSEPVQRILESGQLELKLDGSYQRTDQFRTVSAGVSVLEETTESSTYRLTKDEVRLRLSGCDAITRLRIDQSTGGLSGNLSFCIGLDLARPVAYERIE